MTTISSIVAKLTNEGAQNVIYDEYSGKIIFAVIANNFSIDLAIKDTRKKGGTFAKVLACENGENGENMMTSEDKMHIISPLYVIYQRRYEDGEEPFLVIYVREDYQGDFSGNGQLGTIRGKIEKTWKKCNVSTEKVKMPVEKVERKISVKELLGQAIYPEDFNYALEHSDEIVSILVHYVDTKYYRYGLHHLTKKTPKSLKVGLTRLGYTEEFAEKYCTDGNAVRVIYDYICAETRQRDPNFILTTDEEIFGTNGKSIEREKRNVDMPIDPVMKKNDEGETPNLSSPENVLSVRKQIKRMQEKGMSAREIIEALCQLEEYEELLRTIKDAEKIKTMDDIELAITLSQNGMDIANVKYFLCLREKVRKVSSL